MLRPSAVGISTLERARFARPLTVTVRRTDREVARWVASGCRRCHTCRRERYREIGT
jgi:hypothetical protein